MRLVLFLSRATPLQRWHTIGILRREIAIYHRLRPWMQSLHIVTCGGEEELVYQEQLGDIGILYNRWGLSPNVYSLLAPFLHRHTLRQGTIYKTNQLDGAWTAVVAAKIHHKPVIVRAGYLWADNFERQRGTGGKAALIRRLEQFALHHADGINLTSSAMQQVVTGRYRTPANRIHIVPNYIDIHQFQPLSGVRKIPGRVCFVGRLMPSKNLHLLIAALAPLKATGLVLIGSGSEQRRLQQLAMQHRVRVHFAGRVENHDLPAELNQAGIFVLPSQFEGHPKALIEAMACGLAVIGTDVEGIRDVIQHQETGLLCAPTVEGLRSAVRRLQADPVLRQRLGRAARRFVIRRYSLDQIAQKELAVLQKVQGDTR